MSAKNLKGYKVRIDNEHDWAEISNPDGQAIRRCHADSELIDSMGELIELAGGTVVWEPVTGKRL